MPVQVMFAPLTIQLPDNEPGEVVDTGISTWVPATYTKNQDEIPDSYLWPGAALAATVIWKANMQMEDLCVFPFPNKTKMKAVAML